MFTDKVVLITGASSGIGEETSKHFAILGANLVLNGRNEQNLNRTSVECRKLGAPDVLTVTGDVTVESHMERLVDSAIKRFKKIDVLVNNAGIIENGSIETTSLEQFDRLMSVNVRSIYFLTMIATPYLKQSKGTIVNVSSITGLRAFSNVLAYCMSKAAVEQFTKCVALELAQYQIRVNAVCPGVVETNLHQRGGMDEMKYREFLERCKLTQPLGRPGKSSEVAQVIVFLASSQASFITGASIPIDGGKHALCPR